MLLNECGLLIVYQIQARSSCCNLMVVLVLKNKNGKRITVSKKEIKITKSVGLT